MCAAHSAQCNPNSLSVSPSLDCPAPAQLGEHCLRHAGPQLPQGTRVSVHQELPQPVGEHETAGGPRVLLQGGHALSLSIVGLNAVLGPIMLVTMFPKTELTQKEMYNK